MKKNFIILICFIGLSQSIKSQYSVSFNYGNFDWIPKSNKILDYENLFFLQSINFGNTGLSLWQASCLTKSPNNYELGGIDYVIKFGKFKTRFGFHGYFPKNNFIEYNGNGNLIPNFGLGYNPDSAQNLTANIYQFWDYKFNSQFFVSNLIYKKKT